MTEISVAKQINLRKWRENMYSESSSIRDLFEKVVVAFLPEMPEEVMLGWIENYKALERFLKLLAPPLEEGHNLQSVIKYGALAIPKSETHIVISSGPMSNRIQEILPAFGPDTVVLAHEPEPAPNQLSQMLEYVMSERCDFSKLCFEKDTHCTYPKCRVPQKLGRTTKAVSERRSRPDWLRGKHLHFYRSTTRLPNRES